MASTTEVAIWNRALSKIGSSKPVQTVDEATPEAEACRLAYEDCLDQVLEARPWPFATRQSTLAKPAGVEREGWEHVYAVPTDCVRPLRLLAEGQRHGLLSVEQRHPFSIVENDAGKGLLLCTDLDNDVDDFTVFEYVGRHDHVGSMPRSFVAALVWLLAADLADNLKKDTRKADYCLARYEQALNVATAASFEAAGEPDPEPETPSIAARW